MLLKCNVSKHERLVLPFDFCATPQTSTKNHVIHCLTATVDSLLLVAESVDKILVLVVVVIIEVDGDRLASDRGASNAAC